MKILLLSTIFFLFASCNTSSDETVETLRKAGFTNIVPHGTDWFECGEHDKTGRSFTATNPAGITVEGTVCCGIFKGCTVRF